LTGIFSSEIRDIKKMSLNIQVSKLRTEMKSAALALNVRNYVLVTRQPRPVYREAPRHMTKPLAKYKMKRTPNILASYKLKIRAI
jgi:hypothetical protein